MTTYRYKHPEGHTIERDYPFREAPWQINVDGVTCLRDLRKVSMPPSAGWPLECYASGVNAAQAQELRDEFKRVGVPTEVSADGNPIYRDANHRKRALKARGFYDRNAYY